MPSLWEYVAPAPGDDVCADLVNLMREMAKMRGKHGVIIGEVVYEYEMKTGRRVGGKKMEDKVKEQRQTSWLARVPKIAGLLRTGDKRESPLKRHHRKEQRVYVARGFEG